VTIYLYFEERHFGIIRENILSSIAEGCFLSNASSIFSNKASTCLKKYKILWLGNTEKLSNKNSQSIDKGTMFDIEWKITLLSLGYKFTTIAYKKLPNSSFNKMLLDIFQVSYSPWTQIQGER